MHAHGPLEGDGEHPERKRLAQLGLRRERQLRERGLRLDPAQLLAPVLALDGEQPLEQRAQALPLEPLPLFRRLPLDLGTEHGRIIVRAVAHGFEAVDEQPDPHRWIGVLDRIRAEPFYAAYKARVAELLSPHAGGRYLDVGCGTGDDARALASRFRVAVVGVDVSEAIVAEARRRGLAEALVADAHALPFPDSSFDGALADRILQHLEDPEAALAELVRVTRPGGRIATADPDYETQIVNLRDHELGRRVRRLRVERIRNGALAHRMVELFAEAGLDEIEVEARTLVVRDPAAVDNVMGLRTWAHGTADAGIWERELDEAAARGTFLYAVTFFLTAGRVARCAPR